MVGHRLAHRPPGRATVDDGVDDRHRHPDVASSDWRWHQWMGRDQRHSLRAGAEVAAVVGWRVAQTGHGVGQCLAGGLHRQVPGPTGRIAKRRYPGMAGAGVSRTEQGQARGRPHGHCGPGHRNATRAAHQYVETAGTAQPRHRSHPHFGPIRAVETVGLADHPVYRRHDAGVDRVELAHEVAVIAPIERSGTHQQVYGHRHLGIGRGRGRGAVAIDDPGDPSGRVSGGAHIGTRPPGPGRHLGAAIAVTRVGIVVVVIDAVRPLPRDRPVGTGPIGLRGALIGIGEQKAGARQLGAVVRAQTAVVDRDRSFGPAGQNAEADENYQQQQR